MKSLSWISLVLLLGGCVSMARVDSGDHQIGQRLHITIEGSWNHLNAPNIGPAQNWTQEGLPLDWLLLYSGIKDGELVNAPSRAGNAKDFAFRASMQPDEIVAMFEGMLTQNGSSFELKKLEPYPFGGRKGFHFEFVLTRKVDNVVVTGVGWGAVSKRELFALIYMAPRLSFFDRYAAQVDKIASSARIEE